MFELKNPPADTPEAERNEPLGPRLNCTRGTPAPAELSDDLGHLFELPDPVRQRFWEILAPYLRGEPDQQQSKAIRQLCEQHELDPTQLVPAIKAARFVITNTACSGITREAFLEDLAHLAAGGSKRELIGILLDCFEKSVPVLRDEIVARTIADHSKVVQNTHWRIDKVINSDHGDGIDLPVAVLTFDYQEGSKRDRITLHLLPEQLSELKSALQRMLR